MTSDEDLMLACRDGSDAAFAELFGRYRQPVWAFFRRRISESGRAEELAQEVFVALLKNAGRYTPQAPFRSYLFAIAFNMAAAERRQAIGRWNASLNATQAAPLANTEAALIVRDAIGRLDEPDREILMLREFDELKYGEIAALLDLPINTVRSRLFRARMELRRLLTPSATS